MIKNNTQQKAHNRKRNIVGIILFVILLLLIVFIAHQSCGNSKIEISTQTPIHLEDDGKSLEGEAEARTREDILNELKKQQLIVTDKLSSNITFPSSDIGEIGDWIIENPEENNIIVQAEVYLNDVLIAKSTPIYPNQHITGIALLEEVNSGEYEVTAYLNYYDIETKEFVSKAGYRIHMTVR